MTSPTTGAPSATDLPDYAPVPQSALGPALNDQGYYVGRVERNLYWVTDGTYNSAFLTTRDGVVLFDAPPSIGHNLRRAVDEIAAANGVSNKVTHLIYSHHHADHAGASSLFDGDVVRIGHEETRRLLLRDNDPASRCRRRPSRTAAPWRSAVNASTWRGTAPTTRRTTSSSTFRTTTPSCSSTSSTPGGRLSTSSISPRTCPGYIEAAATALSYPWKHLISGRLATREDVTVHQQYLDDIAANVRAALGTVDPTPYFQKYGENSWAAVKGYLDAVTDRAAAPVIAKYTGGLPAADVFTASTTFWVMESIRLDFGYASCVHPRAGCPGPVAMGPGRLPAARTARPCCTSPAPSSGLGGTRSLTLPCARRSRTAPGMPVWCLRWQRTVSACQEPSPRSSPFAERGTTTCVTSTSTCHSGGPSRWSACPDRARRRWPSARCTRRACSGSWRA